MREVIDIETKGIRYSSLARGIKKAERVMNGFVGIVRAVACIMTLMFLALLAFQVLMRYVFGHPVYGIDEGVVALMVWSTALGTPVVYWEKGHAMIEWLRKYMSRPVRIVFDYISHLIILATTAIFIPSGLTLFRLQKMQMPVGGLPFCRAYYYALPMVFMGVIGVILVTFRILEFTATLDEGLMVRTEEEGGALYE